MVNAQAISRVFTFITISLKVPQNVSSIPAFATQSIHHQSSTSGVPSGWANQTWLLQNGLCLYDGFPSPNFVTTRLLPLAHHLQSATHGPTAVPTAEFEV